MTENLYVMLDDNDVVLNILILHEEPVSEETLQALMKQNNAIKALRLENGEVSENSATTIDPYNAPSIGSSLIGDTFVPPKPDDSQNWILNATNTQWVLPYSELVFEPETDLVTSLELNYWDNQ